MDYQAAYDKANEVAAEALRNTPEHHNSYGCGSTFITIRYKTNPKFYNWAKKNHLLNVDAYYGAILEVAGGLRLVLPNGDSLGTLGEEYYNEQFCKALDAQVETGAFTHTRLN